MLHRYRRASLALASSLLVQPALAQPPEPGEVTWAEREFVPELIVHPPLPEGDWELSVGGVLQRQEQDTGFLPTVNVVYAITDRLSWAPLLATSYRWGETGAAELHARGGLQEFGYAGDDEGWIGTTDAALTAQLWLAPMLSLLAETAAVWDFQTKRYSDGPSRSDQLTLQGSFGGSWRPSRFLTLSMATGLEADVYVRDAPVRYGNRSELAFGSLQQLGYSPLPLLRVHITPKVAFDLHARWAFSLREGFSNRERYQLSFSFLL